MAPGPDSPASEGEGHARWVRPLVSLDRRWTSLEARLCAGVLVVETLVLCGWIVLKGLSTPTTADSKAGLVFRGALCGFVLALVAWKAAKRLGEPGRQIATVAALLVGLAVGALTRSLGVEYFANLLTWLQDASTLTLVGGLRGLGTRLTLLLALLGSSLATASGKHIAIDVAMRFLSLRERLFTAVAGWLAASLVCLTASWGFFDHIAIDSYGARADQPAFEKLAKVPEKVSRHLFFLRKQLALDLKSLPAVLAGERYETAMTGAEWNEWIRSGGWAERFGPEEMAQILLPASAESQSHAPLVVAPGEAVRGMLVHDLNLVLPFGLLMVGLRFLLRALLALGGAASADPDGSHAMEGER